jgi:hypothetical protein
VLLKISTAETINRRKCVKDDQSALAKQEGVLHLRGCLGIEGVSPGSISGPRASS